MADPAVATKNDKTTLSVPADIMERFGELVELIKGSKSMDDGERQYWVDVLPIMSEDQIENLRSILDNEKKQLTEAAAAYSEGMQKNVKNIAVEFNEEAYREKKRARLEAERMAEEQESANEAATLEEIEKL
ncbi:hypothetical protein KJ657_00085 [Patescibacteria group bacterium]|nr:hypothetical protein [Patescibacteria group bacterium]MBU1015476.1 hypothetical protein [Patescibacteria group bacterium]MBU1685189.1 hypothetical protein [Patescibacteria group bacterium]MBU1938600.1 hypothetical protein [Patescibacteria group bacterium]